MNISGNDLSHGHVPRRRQSTATISRVHEYSTARRLLGDAADSDEPVSD